MLALENEEPECTVHYRNEEIKEKAQFSQFKEISLHAQLQTNLTRLQFEKMTSIQKAVINYILQGKDVMGCAQTGSGKTCAFLLPIVNKMLMQGPPSESSSIYSRYT